MHRINLRGPWELSQSSQDVGVYSVNLTRNFNTPTNLDHVSQVILALCIAQAPVSVLLNDQSLVAFLDDGKSSDDLRPEMAAHAEAVSVQRYDVKSTLLSHNKLAIHWQSTALSCVESDTRMVRLITADTNRWLLDAWLEIIES